MSSHISDKYQIHKFLVTPDVNFKNQVFAFRLIWENSKDYFPCRYFSKVNFTKIGVWI